MKRSIALILMLAVCVGGFFALPALKQEAPEVDVVMEVLGVPGDTPIFTVNGLPVSVREYGFWVAYTADTLAYYNNGQALDWNMEEDGFTLREAIENEAFLGSKLFALVESKVKELGLTLSEESQAELDALIADTVEQLGGEEGLKEWLAYNGLSYDEFLRQSTVPFYYDSLATLIDTTGPVTDEEWEQSIVDNDVLRAQHILFMTLDPAAGAALDEAAKAEKLAKAEETLAALQASENLEADFYTLMHELSEDDGLQSNPDGYFFTANVMVDEFEAATRALEYGQMSGIVETSYGYHIILRLDPAGDPKIVETLSASILAERETNMLNDLVNGWLNEAEVEMTEVYDNFEPETYYNALVAMRATLQ